MGAWLRRRGAASLLVPLYVVALGGNPFELGLLGAVATFIGAPGAILWGRIADRTSNPRGVVLVTLAGAALIARLRGSTERTMTE
ncbi:hypothetical protein JCM17823_16450 [Halorubrum gandharaense]